MRYTQATIGNFPLVVLLIPETKSVAVCPVGPLGPFAEAWEGGEAWFDSYGFIINGENFTYNATYALDKNGAMVEWLKHQQLELGPVINTEG